MTILYVWRSCHTAAADIIMATVIAISYSSFFVSLHCILNFFTSIFLGLFLLSLFLLQLLFLFFSIS